MEDSKDSNLTQPSTPSGTPGRKVIQPSAGFAEEIKAQQSAAVQPEIALKPLPRPVAASTVDPMTIKTATVPVLQPSPVDQAAKPELDKPQLLVRAKVIKAVVAGMIVLDVVNVYNWSVEPDVGVWHWARIIGIVISFVLALGLFKLREFARSLYVALAMLLIVLSAVGVLTSYAATRNVPHTSLTRSEVENAIRHAQADTFYTPRERQLELQALNRELNETGGGSAQQQVKRYATDIFSLIVAIGPLVFLTRPSIKQAFS